MTNVNTGHSERKDFSGERPENAGTGIGYTGFFNAMMEHFDAVNVMVIVGDWTDSDPTLTSNLDTFNLLTSAGDSLAEAASKTWTGQRAKDWAYTDVEIVPRLAGKSSRPIRSSNGLFQKALRTMEGILMQIDDAFLDGLRLMFMEGATPSRLIRQIVCRFAAGEDNLHQIVQTCFLQAFDVGPLSISRKQNFTRLDEEDFYKLNYHLIPQIIENFPRWGSCIPSAIVPFWKDLEIKSDREFIRQSAPEVIPELGKNWERLDPEAQKCVQ